MPRGRHRHSPPLHRLLPPSAIAGVSLVCALGPWVFSEPSVLRGSPPPSRRRPRSWARPSCAVGTSRRANGSPTSRARGRATSGVTRSGSPNWRPTSTSRASCAPSWSSKLRAKRAELAGLRNEHAALLRRYATAETERASALEGRRLLEIEATAPEGAPELPTAGAGEDAGEDDGATTAAQATPVPPQGVPAAGAPWASWETASKAAATAARSGKAPKRGAVAASADADVSAEGDVDGGAEARGRRRRRG